MHLLRGEREKKVRGGEPIRKVAANGKYVADRPWAGRLEEKMGIWTISNIRRQKG